MENELQRLVGSVVMSSLLLASVVWCWVRFGTLNLLICANSHLLAISMPKSWSNTTNKHLAVLPSMPRCEYHPRLSLLEHFYFLQLLLFLNQNYGNQQVGLGWSKSDRKWLKIFVEVSRVCRRRVPGSVVGEGEVNLVVSGSSPKLVRKLSGSCPR